MADVDVGIRLSATGGQQTAKEFEMVQTAATGMQRDLEMASKTFSQFALETNMANLEADIAASRKEADLLARGVGVVSDALAELDDISMQSAYADEAEQFAEAMGQAAVSAKQTGSAIRDLSQDASFMKELDRRNSLAGEGGFGANQLVRTGRGLSGLGQVTGVEQLNQVAQGLFVADDIADVSEALQGLRVTAKGLSPELLGLGAAGLSIGAAYLAANKVLNDSVEAIQEITAAREKELEFMRFQRDIQGQSVSELQSQIQATRDAIEEETFLRDKIAQDSGDNVTNMNVLAQGLNVLSHKLGIGSNAIDTATQEVGKHAANINEQTNRLIVLNQELEKQIELERQLAEAANERSQTRFNVDVMEENARREAQLNLEAQEITLETANARIQQAQAEQSALDKTKTAIESIIAANEQRIANEQLTADEITRVNAQNEELRAKLSELAPQIARNAASLEDYKNILLPAAVANEQAAAIRDKETDVIEANKKALADATSQREQVESNLLAIEKELSAIESERTLQLKRRAEQEALAASQADRESDLQAQIDAAKAQEAIVDVRQESAEKELDITQKLAADTGKAFDKLQSDIAKINADFQRDELRAIQDFNRERQRLTEQAEADLLQAALDNDVNAFIRARDTAVGQLADQSGDFDLERQRAAEERDIRIAELQATFEAEQTERQNQAQLELEQLRVENAERIAQIQSAGQERLTVSQQLEQQLLELRKTFAAENAALQRKFEDEDRAARINALVKQQTDLRTIYGQLTQDATVASANLGALMAASLINNFIATSQAAGVQYGNITFVNTVNATTGASAADIGAAVNSAMTEFADTVFAG